VNAILVRLVQRRRLNKKITKNKNKKHQKITRYLMQEKTKKEMVEKKSKKQRIMQRRLKTTYNAKTK